MKSTDISLDRQASSASVIRFEKLSRYRDVNYSNLRHDNWCSRDNFYSNLRHDNRCSRDNFSNRITDADEACRSSEICVDFIIIIVFL